MRDRNRRVVPIRGGLAPRSTAKSVGRVTPTVLAFAMGFAASCIPVRVVAQAEADPAETPGPGIVFDLGGGVGSEGPSALLALGIPVWKGEVVLRAAATSDWELFGGRATVDVGVLFGLRRSGTRSWARFAAGLGAVSRDREAPCESPSFFSCGETKTGAGLLGQVDGVWALHPNFGIGISLHGAVGSDDVGYAAASLGLFIGRAGLRAG